MTWGRPGDRGGRRRSGRRPPTDDPAQNDPAGNDPTGRGDGAPADPEALAREICLRQLTMAPRTRAQLAATLHRRGVPDEVADAVLGRFTDVGLIDDEAFARAWVQSRHAGRGLARRALASELRDRGVADETVKEAVAALDPEQEEAAARQLVSRRLPATRGQDPVKRMRRLVGVLARKGYPAGLAYQVVKDALEAEGGELEDLPGSLD